MGGGVIAMGYPVKKVLYGHGTYMNFTFRRLLQLIIINMIFQLCIICTCWRKPYMQAGVRPQRAADTKGIVGIAIIRTRQAKVIFWFYHAQLIRAVRVFLYGLRTMNVKILVFLITYRNCCSCIPMGIYRQLYTNKERFRDRYIIQPTFD